MKGWLAALLCLAALTVPGWADETELLPPGPPPVLLGDVNSDGLVNTQDRILLSRYLAGWADTPASLVNMQAADVNRDGRVNPLDRMLLTRHLAGWKGYETLG